MAQRHTKHSRLALAAGAAAGLASLTVAPSVSKADITITATNAGKETRTNGTYSVIDFYLTGLNGVDTTNQGNGGTGLAGVLSLSGTFSASGSGALAVAGDSNSSSAGYFGRFITSTTSAPTNYDTSYVNFSGVASDLARSDNFGNSGSTVSGTGKNATVSAVTGTSTSFSGTFFNSDGSTIQPGANTTSEGTNLVARVLATPGYSVSFTGTYGTYGSNGAAKTFTYAAPIVTLAAGTTAPYSNFAQLNTSNATFSPSAAAGPAINVSGGSTGTAHVTTTTGGFAGLNTGYAQISGTTQLYALKLSVAGVTLGQSDSRLATIVTDINAFSASDGITASRVVDAGSLNSGAFAGFDILLKISNAAVASNVLSWNFDNETNVAGLLVTDVVAAAPEPTSLALLGIGAAALVGRRRRR